MRILSVRIKEQRFLGPKELWALQTKKTNWLWISHQIQQVAKLCRPPRLSSSLPHQTAAASPIPLGHGNQETPWPGGVKSEPRQMPSGSAQDHATPGTGNSSTFLWCCPYHQWRCHLGGTNWVSGKDGHFYWGLKKYPEWKQTMVYIS
jgi:hypothetical protein